MNLKDRTLIICASQSGEADQKACLELWARWSPKIRVFLRNTPYLTWEDREDRQQEIMEKTFSSLEHSNPVYSPATWIYTIARRVVIDGYRKRKISEGTMDESFLECLPSHDLTPEEAYIREETKDRIQSFILQ